MGLRNASGVSKQVRIAGLIAGVLGLGAASRAAIIMPVDPALVPVSDPSSLFDVNSNPGNSYSLGTGTNFIPAGFDVRDLFGGSTGTFGPERNDVIFDNNQPIGMVESVNVSLTAPTSLSSFNLLLEDDGLSGDRSASEFLLYADGTLIDDVTILDGTGSQSYTSLYGSNYIQINDSFSGPAPASDYTLEFVQNRDGNAGSGIRAMEFTATAASTTTVPEPKALACLAGGGCALLRRRRRVAVPV